eukprot:scaffold496_cov236-Pinguiococcus_pyrenoidosus.AAC.8
MRFRRRSPLRRTMPHFPGAPVRPLNSRRLFVADFLVSVRQKNPHFSKQDAEAFLLELWKRQLTPEERQPYVHAARQLRLKWRDAYLEHQAAMRSADGKAGLRAGEQERARAPNLEHMLLASPELRDFALPGLQTDTDTCACFWCRIRDQLWLLEAATPEQHAAPKLPRGLDEDRRRMEQRRRLVQQKLRISSRAQSLPRDQGDCTESIRQLQSLSSNILELVQDAEQLLGRSRGEESLYVPP